MSGHNGSTDLYRAVEVDLEDGHRVRGVLEAYRDLGDTWSGFVRYSVHPGEVHMRWFDGKRITGNITTEAQNARDVPRPRAETLW